MDKSVMGGGLLQGSGGMILDLDHSMHRHYASMISQPLNPQLQQPHQLSHGGMILSGADQSMSVYEPPPGRAAVAAGMAVPSGVAFRTKLGSSSPSEDDDDHDASFNTDDAAPRGRKGGGGGPSSSSPWQRMKWTDDMVRLLISVVACVGDDGPPEDGPIVGSKRKLSTGGGGSSSGAHALQKKGKWKTVSKLMLEKGCYVSPQQCEDKFNDLNKRYKRLNDILGRGTTCQVVENPSLLDSVPGVSPKAKDDVRKILASKHLFYREMCAYHHGQKIPNPHDADPLPSCAAGGACGAMIAVPSLPMKNGDADADCGGSGGTGANEEDDDEEDEEEAEEQGPAGSGRSMDLGKAAHGNYQSNFQTQMDAVLQDPTKSAWEVQQWIKRRALQLQEEKVEIHMEALELEKKRFKWHRFCNKKDRELEQLRLENERMGLENERMSMQLRLKAADLDSRRSTSSTGGDLGGSFQAVGLNQ